MNPSSNVIYRASGWNPRADLYRCQHGWLLKFELAGVPEEDITIRAEDTRIIIEGRRRDWTATSISRSVLMEITYDWFRRRIELPSAVDPASLHSEYRDGMLLIRLNDLEQSHG